MPTAYGITAHILCASTQGTLPEYPCPQPKPTAIKKTTKADKLQGKQLHATDLTTFSSPKADRMLGRFTKTDVYIESKPGFQFAIRWSIAAAEPSATPPVNKYWYFRLFMNGRHVTSWGTGPGFPRSDIVAYAAFDASVWNTENDGQGSNIELRPFLFSTKIAKTLAEDGGHIELKIYRAKEKADRIHPILESYNPQEAYGLLLPRGVSMAKPEDLKFDEWILFEHIDRPYTTFRFFYRTWEFLVDLHIVRKNQSRDLLKTSTSGYVLNRLATTKPLRVDEKSTRDHGQDEDSDTPDDTAADSEAHAEAELSRLMESRPDKGLSRKSSGLVLNKFRDSIAQTYSLVPLANRSEKKNPTNCRHKKSSQPEERQQNFMSYVPKKRSEERTEKHCRPLPDLPLPPRASSLEHSKSYTVSRAPSSDSITQSLRSWAIRSDGEDEYYGVAQIMAVPLVRFASVKQYLGTESGDDVFVDGPSNPADRQKTNLTNIDHKAPCTEYVAPPPQPVFTLVAQAERIPALTQSCSNHTTDYDDALLKSESGPNANAEFTNFSRSVLNKFPLLRGVRGHIVGTGNNGLVKPLESKNDEDVRPIERPSDHDLKLNKATVSRSSNRNKQSLQVAAQNLTSYTLRSKFLKKESIHTAENIKSKDAAVGSSRTPDQHAWELNIEQECSRSFTNEGLASISHKMDGDQISDPLRSLTNEPRSSPNRPRRNYSATSKTYPQDKIVSPFGLVDLPDPLRCSPPKVRIPSTSKLEIDPLKHAAFSNAPYCRPHNRRIYSTDVVQQALSPYEISAALYQPSQVKEEEVENSLVKDGHYLVADKLIRGPGLHGRSYCPDLITISESMPCEEYPWDQIKALPKDNPVEDPYDGCDTNKGPVPYDDYSWEIYSQMKPELKQKHSFTFDNISTYTKNDSPDISSLNRGSVVAAVEDTTIKTEPGNAIFDYKKRAFTAYDRSSISQSYIGDQFEVDSYFNKERNFVLGSYASIKDEPQDDSDNVGRVFASQVPSYADYEPYAEAHYEKDSYSIGEHAAVTDNHPYADSEPYIESRREQDDFRFRKSHLDSPIAFRSEFGNEPYFYREQGHEIINERSLNLTFCHDTDQYPSGSKNPRFATCDRLSAGHDEQCDENHCEEEGCITKNRYLNLSKHHNVPVYERIHCDENHGQVACRNIRASNNGDPAFAINRYSDINNAYLHEGLERGYTSNDRISVINDLKRTGSVQDPNHALTEGNWTSPKRKQQRRHARIEDLKAQVNIVDKELPQQQKWQTRIEGAEPEINVKPGFPKRTRSIKWADELHGNWI